MEVSNHSTGSQSRPGHITSVLDCCSKSGLSTTGRLCTPISRSDSSVSISTAPYSCWAGTGGKREGTTSSTCCADLRAASASTAGAAWALLLAGCCGFSFTAGALLHMLASLLLPPFFFPPAPPPPPEQQERESSLLIETSELSRSRISQSKYGVLHETVYAKDESTLTVTCVA